MVLERGAHQRGHRLRRVALPRLNLEGSRLARSQTAIRRLVTWGALITMAGASLAVYWLLDWSWLQAALFGSLVVVTGPTVVGPLVGELRLRPRVATVLEAADVFRVSETRMRQTLKDAEAAAVIRVGRLVRVRRAWLEDLVRGK